jgi:hypothetical protein
MWTLCDYGGGICFASLFWCASDWLLSYCVAQEPTSKPMRKWVSSWYKSSLWTSHFVLVMKNCAGSVNLICPCICQKAEMISWIPAPLPLMVYAIVLIFLCCWVETCTTGRKYVWARKHKGKKDHYLLMHVVKSPCKFVLCQHLLMG